MGRRRLSQLQYETTRSFFDIRTIEVHGPKTEQLRLCLNLLHTEITTLAASFPLLSANTSFSDGIFPLMQHLVSPVDEVDLYPGKCPLCESPDGDSPGTAERPHGLDLGASFEACRNRLIWHYRDMHSCTHIMNVERVIGKLEEYERLAERLISDVSETLKKLVGRDLAKLSRAVGLYHDDRIIRLEESVTVKDCLRRTALHCWLDQLYRPNMSDLVYLQHLIPLDAGQTRDMVNQLDILDRSPLYIACQKNWKQGVVKLLQAGADPTVCTVYRTTPLHFAAAEGHGEICNALLDFMPISAQTTDCSGKTAFDYALAEGHIQIASRILQVSSGLRDGVMYM